MDSGRHLAENTGDQPFEVILVELKTRRPKPGTNSTAIKPADNSDHYAEEITEGSGRDFGRA